MTKLEKILIVEDNSENLDQAREWALKRGITATFATDLVRAERILQQGDITAVITDMVYPVETGADRRIDTETYLRYQKEVQPHNESLQKLRIEYFKRGNRLYRDLIIAFEDSKRRLELEFSYSASVNARETFHFGRKIVNIARLDERKMSPELIEAIREVDEYRTEIMTKIGIEKGDEFCGIYNPIALYQDPNPNEHPSGLQMFDRTRLRSLPVVILSSLSAGTHHELISETLTVPLSKVYPGQVLFAEGDILPAKKIEDWQRAYDALYERK